MMSVLQCSFQMRKDSGENSQIKVTGVIVVPFRGYNSWLIVPFRLFKSQMTTITISNTQGEQKTVPDSGMFEITEFEIARLNCIRIFSVL